MSEQTQIKVWDDFDEILKNGRIDAIAFDLATQPNGLTIVAQTICSMGKILEEQSGEWEDLFKDNREKMDLWRNRLYVVQLAMRAVTKDVADLTRELDWDDIARNLGLINAFRTAGELAIGYYKAEREHQNAIGGA